jgi:CRISPR type III-associated protein (TIGR04423 family)
MKERHKTITLADIPTDVIFDGYLWLSNATKPITMKAERVDNSLFEKLLPFVVEGNLWSEELSLSIQIRNVDGAYIVQQFDLTGSDQDPLLDDKEDYLAHDLDGIAKYRVVEAWQEEQQDKILAGMKTLVPAWTAFKGFVHDKKQPQ